MMVCTGATTGAGGGAPLPLPLPKPKGKWRRSRFASTGEASYSSSSSRSTSVSLHHVPTCRIDDRELGGWAVSNSTCRQHRLRVSCMCDSMPAAVSCCCWGDIPASIASNNPATMTFIMQRFVVPAEEKKSVVSFGPWASVVQHMRSRHQLQTGICRESCQHKASQNLLSIIVEIIHVAAEHSSSHGSNSKPNCIDATTAHHVVS